MFNFYSFWFVANEDVLCDNVEYENEKVIKKKIKTNKKVIKLIHFGMIEDCIKL